MNQFAKNLISISRTQSRLAKIYAKWAAEGGHRSDEYAVNAKRLARESTKHAELAEREMNNG